MHVDPPESAHPRNRHIPEINGTTKIDLGQITMCTARHILAHKISKKGTLPMHTKKDQPCHITYYLYHPKCGLTLSLYVETHCTKLKYLLHFSIHQIRMKYLIHPSDTYTRLKDKLSQFVYKPELCFASLSLIHI